MRGHAVLDAKSGAPLGKSSILSVISMAVAQYGERIDSVAKHRIQANARKLDSLVAQMQVRMDSSTRETVNDGLKRKRNDAFDAAGALFMSRQLEHRYADVLREEFPAQNAFTLFPTDQSVPPGARTHTVTRLYQDGEAAVYRGGQEIPRVGISQQEEQFPVRHYVTSFEYDIFSMMSANFANFALAAELLRTARDIINEFANLKTWYGDDVNGIKGVLNYPWLNKKLVATPFTDASATDSIMGELRDLANYPTSVSKAVYSPNRCVTSPRIKDYILGRARSTNSDKTIGEYFTSTNAYIKQIDAAWELQGVGPGGTDGILMYRDDRLGIANVIVQPFTTLPVEQEDYRFVTNCYMSHGGVIMRNSLNNILGWVTPPTGT